MTLTNMQHFGLDIGSHSLKIAQVEKSKDKARLIAFGSAAAPPRGLLSETEADLTALAVTIKKLHQEARIATKNVAAALPEDQVFSKVVTFPKLAGDELASAIKWEAEQYVPIPLDEVNLDYQIVAKIKEGVTEKIEVLLVAAPKKLIEKTLKVLKVAGLNPVALETEILALARSLVPPDSEASLLVLADLGARATDIAIVEAGQVVLTRSIPTAGEALTRAVASGLELEPSQAEAYKKAYGVDPAQLEGKVRGAISPVLEPIVKEMEKAIQFYYSAKKKQVKQVILTGGTAVMPEFVAFLAQKLNLEIQVGDPFARLEKDKEMLAKIPAGVAPLYGIAIGLALKDVG